MFRKTLLLLTAAIASSAPARDTIAVIPMGTTHEYWKSIHAGALRAEAELNAAGRPTSIIWKGPLREDDRDQQIQVVENFIGRGVSGIVLAPLDDRALIGPVEEAVSARIPVVLIDSSLASKSWSSCIATDNREGGRIAGRRLGRLLGGRGRAILLRCMPGSFSSEERAAGFLEVMGRDFPGIELVSTNQYAGPTRDTARRVAETLLARYAAGLGGVFAVNESAAAGMLQALRDAGLAGGRVKFVGFDTGRILVDGLASGDVQGLVVQDPFRIGYLGVRTASAILHGGKPPRLVNTPATLATPENRNEPAIAALLHPRQREN